MAAKIRKGDTVFVLAGKDRTKRGEVDRVLPKAGRIVVQGVNMIKRHQRAKPGVRQGGIIERPNALNISNVALVCPNCDEPTKVAFTFLEDGRKVRRCKKCDETFD